MSRIRYLYDLRMNGTRKEQDFVDLFVTSKLECRPDRAESDEWQRAWDRAQDHWELANQEMRMAGCDDAEAERRAMGVLRRGAMARLDRLERMP